MKFVRPTFPPLSSSRRLNQKLNIPQLLSVATHDLNLKPNVLTVSAIADNYIPRSGAATVICPTLDFNMTPAEKSKEPGFKIGSYAEGRAVLCKAPNNSLMTMYNQSSDAMTSSDNSPEGSEEILRGLRQPQFTALEYLRTVWYEMNHPQGRKSFPHNETTYSSNQVMGALFIGSAQTYFNAKSFAKFRAEVSEKFGCDEAYFYCTDLGILSGISWDNKEQKINPDDFADCIKAADFRNVELFKKIERQYWSNLEKRVDRFCDDFNALMDVRDVNCAGDIAMSKYCFDVRLVMEKKGIVMPEIMDKKAQLIAQRSIVDEVETEVKNVPGNSPQTLEYSAVQDEAFMWNRINFS